MGGGGTDLFSITKKVRLRSLIGSNYASDLGVLCSLVGICCGSIRIMIMIACVHCSFLIWFSLMVFILHLKILPRSFRKWGDGN